MKKLIIIATLAIFCQIAPMNTTSAFGQRFRAVIAITPAPFINVGFGYEDPILYPYVYSPPYYYSNYYPRRYAMGPYLRAPRYYRGGPAVYRGGPRMVAPRGRVHYGRRR